MTPAAPVILPSGMYEENVTANWSSNTDGAAKHGRLLVAPAPYPMDPRTPLALAAVLLALQLARARNDTVLPEPSRCATLSGARARRNVTVAGEDYSVVLYWNGEPARVAATMLLHVMRDVLGYAGLRLRHGGPSPCSYTTRTRNELVVMPAAELDSETPCDLSNLGLVVLHKAAAPLTVRPHALLQSIVRADPACTFASVPAFYSNVSFLRHCGFIQHNEEISALSARATPLREEADKEDASKTLRKYGSPRVESISRKELRQLVLNAQRSILFVDYEIWSDVPGVLPLVVESGERSAQVFVASEALRTYAPPLYEAMMNFSIEQKELQELLEAEEQLGGWQQAICKQLVKHADLLPIQRYDFWIAIVVCVDDPDSGTYISIVNQVGSMIWNITKSRGYGIGISELKTNCSDKTGVSDRLSGIKCSKSWYQCIGAVVPAFSAEHAAVTAAKIHLPITVYGGTASTVRDTAAPAGTTTHLVSVLHTFLASHRWHRLAVLSEPTGTAKTLLSSLQADERLMLRDVQLNNSTAIAESLGTLAHEADARIFLINGGWRTARAVLREAECLNLTAELGYVWLALEWRGDPPVEKLRLFTITFICNASGSLADATLTLGLGFAELEQSETNIKFDLHSPSIYRKFWKTLDRINATGVCQPSLRYQNGALLAPQVYVTEPGARGARQHLGTWIASAGPPRALSLPLDPYAGRGAPSDGQVLCWWARGDAFAPECRESVVLAWGAAAVLVLLLAAACTWAMSRQAARRRTITQLLEKQKFAHRERIVATLVDKLVDREALDLREELGCGRFGCVRLAILRASGRRPRAVAAKALHGDSAPAEESEFLSEACTLATLEHEHVIRLVGVCAVGGPLLVLMEHAFFGDLLQYLRVRRYLAEGAVESLQPEAEHVSAGELTRLAREAAAALGYLAHRGLVHRDVRAANCLVDVRRRLKLGDFGMARGTDTRGAHGEAEYACRRRGLFPVLWMSPESLSRGAFSAASDVWAYGVLVLEVMTLGDRPYGAWPPPRVVHHVLGGGRPRLPADASVQARGLALSCWRQRASERPTAADLVAYLAEHPRTLAPALAPVHELGSVDSGFCESAVADKSDRCISITVLESSHAACEIK